MERWFWKLLLLSPVIVALAALLAGVVAVWIAGDR
jgi:hypothetical protein